MMSADFFDALRDAEQRLRYWNTPPPRGPHDPQRCWMNDTTGSQCSAEATRPVGLCDRHIRTMQGGEPK